MAAESESVLIRRFSADGDASAFSEIVRRHVRMVYGVCVRILENESDAADATQETFYQLLKQAREVSGSVASWLHTVATRKSIDLIRRGKARRRRERSYASSITGEVEQWHDISGHVDNILQELDEGVRSVLLEHFFEGKTTTQIAGERGISQATASRRVNQGLDLLRAALKKRGLLATGAVLTALLGSEASSYAVPAVVASELTKMAMVGSSVAGGVAATGAATGAKAAAGGMMAGLSGKVAAAVAVAAIGVCSVVTYNHITEPADAPAPIVAEDSSSQSPSRPPLQTPGVQPATAGVETEQIHEEPAASAQGDNDDEFDKWFDEFFVEGDEEATGPEEPAGALVGGMGMGMRMGTAAPDETGTQEANSPPVFWGAGMAGSPDSPPIDINELAEELADELQE